MGKDDGVTSILLLGIAVSLIGGGALIVRATRERVATFSSALSALRAMYENDPFSRNG